jgi:predicted 2-oxoglutarate/Fe(II)-dependent dioxygenase YbiX
LPSPDFFSHLGLYVVKGFLTPVECAQLRSEIRQSASSATTVKKGDKFELDETTRKVHKAKISDTTKASISERMFAMIPALSKHFAANLTSGETPQFLIYRNGYFYTQHIDTNIDPKAPNWLKARKVSMIIFLNNQSDSVQEDTYCGGALVFYGLMKGAGWENKGFPMIGQEGTMIAFASDVLHEVTPVTDGVRYTVVTWFTEPYEDS